MSPAPDALTGYPPAGRGRQPRDHPTDVVRGREAAERGALDDRVLEGIIGAEMTASQVGWHGTGDE